MRGRRTLLSYSARTTLLWGASFGSQSHCVDGEAAGRMPTAPAENREERAGHGCRRRSPVWTSSHPSDRPSHVTQRGSSFSRGTHVADLPSCCARLGPAALTNPRRAATATQAQSTLAPAACRPHADLQTGSAPYRLRRNRQATAARVIASRLPTFDGGSESAEGWARQPRGRDTTHNRPNRATSQRQRLGHAAPPCRILRRATLRASR